MKKIPQNRTKSGTRGTLHDPPTNAFKPGESGNPGGRPKMTEAQREAKEAKAMAQPAAVKALVAIIESKSAEPRDIIAAAKVILDGLETLKIDLDANVTADVKHDVKAEVIQSPERMRTIIAVLQRAGQLDANTETATPVETKEEAS